MLLLFSFLFLNTPPLQTDPASFKHFKHDGNAPYCLVNYTKKEIHCVYEDSNDCADHLDEKNAEICFPRKSLKLGDAQ